MNMIRTLQRLGVPLKTIKELKIKRSPELTGENRRQVFIPRGFAHGFIALEDDTVFSYKCDNPYAPEHEGGITPYDKALGIDWRLAKAEHILSEKDALQDKLREGMR